jgi:hypothetical protein
MMLYAGNARATETRAKLKEMGAGIMHSGGFRSYRDLPFCIDNGAFGAWLRKEKPRPWDFIQLCKRYYHEGMIPDFVVVPDIVAGGPDSLRFSLQYSNSFPPGFKRYLAVQDGMSETEVANHLILYEGLFVGGTKKWKMATSRIWVKLSHRVGKKCHVGRIGIKKEIEWAMGIGVDSIDSTSWGRAGSWHHVEDLHPSPFSDGKLF